MNTASAIALPASSDLPADSPIARLTQALHSLRLRFGAQASGPDFMDLDPKDQIHESLPEHPADRIRRETVDRVRAACPYLR
jgi:hypothetical protein